MKGSFHTVLISGVAATFLALVLGSSAAWSADAPKADAAKTDATKPEKKLPAVLDKPAPASVEELKAIQEHVKTVLKKVVPATVGVRIGGAAGSGVIISADGYVLTAGHVSGAPNQNVILILPNGKTVKGKSLGRNTDMDSGLIKITDKGKWNFVEMGDSQKLKRGQWCLAVGHPGGFKPGRSPVVRLGRVLMSVKSVVQTDCTLVGGDSGGPLFDMEGKVIGIHSRIGPSIVANMHVPVNTFRDTWDKLTKGESLGAAGRPVNAAYMGVRFSSEGEGLEISKVYENSPAEKAGLKVGDVIVGIDGTKIASRDDMASFLQKKKPDDEVTIEVQRDKTPMMIKLKLGKRPAD